MTKPNLENLIIKLPKFSWNRDKGEMALHHYLPEFDEANGWILKVTLTGLRLDSMLHPNYGYRLDTVQCIVEEEQEDA